MKLARAPSFSVSNFKGAKAAGLRNRLRAAQKCQAEGFVVGFHFDPLIYHHRWQEEYKKTMDMLDRYIDPSKIIWVSLGSFRFMPQLKAVIRKRHPATITLDGEFIHGLDGKMRYFKPLRIGLYQKMISWIREFSPEVLIYFCMEDDEVWRKSLGFVPPDRGGLPKMLDESAVRVCGLDKF